MAKAVPNEGLGEVPPYWRVDVSRAGVILDNPLAVELHHVGPLCKGPEVGGGTQEAPPSADSHQVFVPLESSTNSSCVSLDSLQDDPAQAAGAFDSRPPCDPERLRNCLDPHRSLDKQTFLRLKLQQLQARQVLQQERLRLQHNEQMGRLREEQHRLLSIVALPPYVLDQDAISVDPCSKPSQPGPTEFIPISGGQKEDEFATKPPPVPGAETALIMSALPPQRPLCLKETVIPNFASNEWPTISALCGESVESGLKKSFDEEECSKFEKRTDGGNAQTASSRDLEDRPIRPGLGGQKTFEQLLEEKLKFEEDQHLNTNYSRVKRVFLRKGEGVARFGKNKENVPLGQNLARGARSSNDEGIEIAVDSRSAVEHRPFKQRNKLCGLQTQYFSKSTQSMATRPKPKPLQKKKNNVSALSNKSTAHRDDSRRFKGIIGDNQGKRNELKLIYPNQPCESRKEKRVPLMDKPVEDNRSLDFDAVRIVEQVVVAPTRTEHHGDPKGLERLSECSFELSFQQKIGRWDSDQKRDAHELSEFELLEAKAALDASLHSNASFLLHLPEKCEGSEPLRRNSSTPLQATPQHVPEIDKSSKQKDRGLGGNRHYAEAVTNDVWTENIPVGGEKDKPGGCVPMVLLGMIDGKSDSKKADVNLNQCDLKTEGEQREDYCFLHESGGISNHNDAIVSSSDDDTTEDMFSDVSGVVEQDPGSEDAPDFDDDHTWLNDCQSEHNNDDDDDDEDTLVEVSGGTSPAMGKALTRKVASVRMSEDLAESVSASAQDQRCSPPTSQLIAKLFPALRPKLKPTIPLEKQQFESETIAVPEDAVPSRLLHERLAQLEAEIARFRMENSTLARLRQERESAVAIVHKEMEEFERYKNDELVKLEELKKEEMRKMRKERRVFEKHAAAARAIPDKQEREEMQALRKELAEVREEMQRREARSAVAQARLRDQVYTLTKENGELREESRRAEQLRLAARSKTVWTGRPRGGPNDVPKGSLAVPLSQAVSRSASAPRASSRRSCSPVSLQPKLGERKKPFTCSSTKDVACKTALSTSVSEDTPRISLIGVPQQCGVMPEAAGNHGAKEENVPSLEGSPAGRISDSQDDLVKDKIQYPDGKLELVMQSGRHVITFPNGTRKEISADAKLLLITFFNGDVKQVFPDQRVVYYYAEAQTTQTTYPDGLEILQFPNKQMEKHYPNGTTEIVFPDETIKYLHPDGNEESIFPDGTIIRLQQNGDKVIEFDNGQREVHTIGFKRREYPDGTTKTVFADGRQETKYSSGRVRIKDCDGNVIFDDHA